MVLRHDIAKKQHRERAQPLERRKWGLLEKKKDYQLRAKDFHKKEAHIKLLKKKVELRNPDEFHHSMVSKRTDSKGILIAERPGSKPLSTDSVKLLKTQDSGYIRTLNNVERRKIDRLESEVMIPGTGKHTVFVEDAKEAKLFKPEKFFDTDAALLYRRENRLRKSQLEDKDNLVAPSSLDQRKRLSKLKELDRRLDRKQELINVQQEMELQRELMKKGDKKKIVDSNGNVTFKWKKVRKR